MRKILLPNRFDWGESWGTESYVIFKGHRATNGKARIWTRQSGSRVSALNLCTHYTVLADHHVQGPSTNCPQKENVPNLLEMESQLHSISSLGIWRYWIWSSNRELGRSTWSQTFLEGGGAGSRRWLVRCPRSNQTSQFNHGADASPVPGFTKKPAPNSGLGITTGHQRKWGPYTPHLWLQTPSFFSNPKSTISQAMLSLASETVFLFVAWLV